MFNIFILLTIHHSLLHGAHVAPSSFLNCLNHLNRLNLSHNSEVLTFLAKRNGSKGWPLPEKNFPKNS
jgi:hypothetical protein